MFEDLIGESNRKTKMEKKIEHDLANQVCPFCASKDIEPTQGRFMLGNYVQTMLCIVCSTEWTVTYDHSLNIIGVSF